MKSWPRELNSGRERGPKIQTEAPPEVARRAGMHTRPRAVVVVSRGPDTHRLDRRPGSTQPRGTASPLRCLSGGARTLRGSDLHSEQTHGAKSALGSAPSARACRCSASISRPARRCADPPAHVAMTMQSLLSPAADMPPDWLWAAMSQKQRSPRLVIYWRGHIFSNFMERYSSTSCQPRACILFLNSSRSRRRRPATVWR
jgi:hypothetical protein